MERNNWIVLKYIELFAGIGGFRLGLENCNIELSSIKKGVFRQGNKSDITSEGEGKHRNEHTTYTCIFANEKNKKVGEHIQKQGAGGRSVRQNWNKPNIDTRETRGEGSHAHRCDYSKGAQIVTENYLLDHQVLI